MRQTFPWTEDLATHAAYLYRGGLSSSEIAAELAAMTGHRLTRNSVIGRLFRMGVMGYAKRRYVRDNGFQTRKSTKVKKPTPERTMHLPVAAPKKVNGPVVAKPEPLEPVEPLNVPFAKLQAFHCRAVTDPTRYEQRFCGHFRTGASPYCAAHAAIYAAPVQSKGKAA